MFEKSVRDYNKILCDKITALIGCDVVKSNSTGPVPKYPYVSFTTTGIHTHGRTYGDDGERLFTQATAAYSWTVQSDDDNEAMDLAQKLHDFFDRTGRTDLRDHGITVGHVGDISARDNILTVEYEYRKGFDTTFYFLNITDRPDETIETADFNHNGG